MKKKSFTRALAGISAAVLLAVSLPPQTIPAMAAENSTQEGGSSQEDQADAPQPAAANEVQAAEGKSDQAEEEKANTSAEMNQEAETSQEGSASADAASEAGKSADSAQQTGANQSANAAGTASSDDKTDSALNKSSTAEEAASGETADAEEGAAEGQTIADPAKENEQPEGTVTVTYEASEGGHVSKESETFVKGADRAALTGAEAAAEDGYEFVDWTEDGVEVSTDAVFIPDVTTIDADTTFTANFKAKEAEETYPAVDFAPMTMSDGTEILVSAPEGAFPAGVQMRASVVAPEQVVDAIAEATPDDDAVDAEQIAAYNISFYLPADSETEIEPRKAVQVSFENLPLHGEVTKDSSLEVWHIDDSQVANAGDIEKQSTDGDVSVSIKAQAFSTYAIRAKAQKGSGGLFNFECPVNLADDIQITPKTTAMQDLRGTISVTIKEQEILGYIRSYYDEWYKNTNPLLRKYFFNNKWYNAAYTNRALSKVPLTLVLPEGLSFENVKTSSDSKLLTISKEKGKDDYLGETTVLGNKLTVYLNFTGSPSDKSVRFFHEVLENCTEDGTLRISAEYKGKMPEGFDEKDIKLSVSEKDSQNSIKFGGNTAVYANVSFTGGIQNIPAANVNSVKALLDTDILVRDSEITGSEYVTESEKVFETRPGGMLSFAADVDVSSIKKLMDNIEVAYDQQSHEDDIALSNLQSEFTAVITVPEGLTFPTDKEFYHLSGTNAFDVSNVTVDGRNITVTMPLRGKSEIHSYADLYKKIHDSTNTGDSLRLEVNGVRVNDDAVGLLTVMGSVNGTMTSDAYQTASGGTQKFSFTWYGKQTDDGKDVICSENENYPIQLTVKVDSMLYGDASVRKSGTTVFDTEHDAVFKAQQGDILDFEAVLNVSSIKRTIGKLGNENTNIPFQNNAESEFALELSADDGLIYPTKTSDYELTSGSAGAFGISSVTFPEENHPRVIMTLKDGYDNFSELYKAIHDGTNDYIILTIKGMKVADNALGRQKAIGKISGHFKADYTDGSSLLDTTWSALQDTHIRGDGGDGTDYVLGEAKDSNPIQLTIDVSKRTEPVTPETPETPAPNSDTPAQTNGTPSSSGETPSSVNVTTSDSEVVPTNTAKVLGASRPATAPIENAAQPAEPQKVLGAKRENHQIATGDDSQMMLYGVLALAAAAGAIIWLVRYRRRER